MFGFIFPFLSRLANIKILNLLVFSVAFFCTAAVRKSIKKHQMDSDQDYSSKPFAREALKRRFLFSIIIILLIPLMILGASLYPSIFDKIDIRLMILSAIGASMIGFFSVNRDINSLLQIIARVKLLSKEQYREKISMEASPEISELVDSFNLLISDMQIKMEELKDAQKRIESLVSRIGKAISSTSSMEDLLNLMLEISTDALKTDSSYLYIIDPLKKMARWQAFTKGDETSREMTRLQEKMLLLANGGDIMFENHFIAMPLMQKEKILGVLGIARKSDQKPFQYKDKELLQNIADQTALAIEINYLQAGSEKMHFEIISALAMAIEARDPHARGHLQRTRNIAAAIATQLRVSPQQLRIIKDAAFLHDIGKVGIPDTLLNKAGELTDNEQSVIRQHPLVGERILKSVQSLKTLLPGVLQHHERPDGKGYPAGLKESQIDFSAGIIHVADAADNAFSRSSDSNPCTLQQLMQVIKDGINTRFSKAPAEALLAVLENTGADIVNGHLKCTTPGHLIVHHFYSSTPA